MATVKRAKMIKAAQMKLEEKRKEWDNGTKVPAEDTKIKYIIKQICDPLNAPRDVWASEPMTADHLGHVKQCVLSGWLSGQPRWAELVNGTFLTGLDVNGTLLISLPRVLSGEWEVREARLSPATGGLFVHGVNHAFNPPQMFSWNINEDGVRKQMHRYNWTNCACFDDAARKLLNKWLAPEKASP